MNVMLHAGVVWYIHCFGVKRLVFVMNTQEGRRLCIRLNPQNRTHNSSVRSLMQSECDWIIEEQIHKYADRP